MFQFEERYMTEYGTQVSILLSRGFLLNLSSLLQGKVNIFKLGGRLMYDICVICISLLMSESINIIYRIGIRTENKAGSSKIL